MAKFKAHALKTETGKHGVFFFFSQVVFLPMCVQNNEELFELLMQKYIYFLDHVKDETYLTLKFVEPIMYDLSLIHI